MSIAAGSAADIPVPRLQAHDRLCMIGDSITHSGIYHSLIHLFYATRFPEQRFDICNCGISGDSADGAVGRFDWDIVPNQPTLAAIMLGMNDIWRGLYGANQAGTKVEARRKEALDRYLANMTALANRLKAANCRLIFITPSIYDQTVRMEMENLSGCNDALGKCAIILRELAPKCEAAIVDFHGPMTELNLREQRKNPEFTLVGGDRVHPGSLGHCLMAYLFLKAQQVSSCVAKMSLDARSGKAMEEVNCKISNARVLSEGGVAFTALEGALPFPIAPEAAGIVDLVPFEKELNQELLVIGNLAGGSYEILIDDVCTAIAPAEDLAQGVNLAMNSRTPMYRHALEIQKLGNDLRSITADNLRVFAMWRQWVGNNVNDPEDFTAMKAEVLKYLETNNDEYFRKVASTYITMKPKEADLKAEAGRITADIWKINKPGSHNFVVRKTGK